jgi:hypothetical protein
MQMSTSEQVTIEATRQTRVRDVSLIRISVGEQIVLTEFSAISSFLQKTAFF